jgi:hypothetical protein
MVPSPQVGGSRAFMPHELVETKRYTMAELYEQRRVIIKHSRSMPPGRARNKHRQIATSMRSLSSDREWLAAHAVDGVK